MHKVAALDRIAVLIATRDRPSLLRRALASVDAQQVRPDIVVVVDDGDESHAAPASWPELALYDRVRVIRNERTPGAAGAWNTGLFTIREAAADPERWFVAVLDDDDHWEPDHLGLCADAARTRELQMVIAGLVRHDDTGVHAQSIPTRLDPDELLVRNPHVQGSNLFVRLDVLLRCGMFDEALRSCTDRDICLRITDLGDVRVGSIDQHTVHHHAETGRDRLSTPGSAAKGEGLDAFWAKYRGRMSEGHRAAFIDRSQRLFAWSPPEAIPLVPWPEPATMEPPPHPIALVVGIIADAARPERVAPLLADLRELARDPDVCGIDVVLLENGPRPLPGAADLAQLVEQSRADGQRVWIVTIEQQQQCASRGVFGAPFDRGDGRASIACARTMLQRHVARVQRSRPYSIGWILDDDKRLDALVALGGQRVSRRVPFVRTLLELQARGVGAVLGVDTDAPPVPWFAIARTALVDLQHALVELAALSPDDEWPDRSAENARLRDRFPDYAYDFANHTAHLECPVCPEPVHPFETVRSAMIRLGDFIDALLRGAHPTRPLSVAVPVRPEDAATASSLRGGHTFVLDPEFLDTPNGAPSFDGEDTRRSDMIWAIAHRARRADSIVRAQLPVRHARDSTASGSADLTDAYRDILGHAVQAALAEAYPPGSGLIPDALRIERATKSFSSHLWRRVAAFDANVWRVHGLATGICRVLTGPAWWHDDPAAAAVARHIRGAVTDVVDRLSLDRIAALRERLLAANPETFRAFAKELPDRVERFASAGGMDPRVYDEFDAQRRQLAERQIRRAVRAGALRYLGEGCEGVAFTDGEWVYKVFDYWKARTMGEQRAFLRGLVGRWTATRHLYGLRALHEDGHGAVLVYAYEESAPYEVGHGADLVGLLRECRTQGVVCRNIKPKNLRVTAEGLRLIDYGADTRPYSELEWAQMVRRVWLTWRWPRHPRLADLMRAALTDPNLPELDGVDMVLRAVDEVPAVVTLRELLAAEVLSSSAQTVLDYGCGKGDLTRMLGARGLEVLGYDPDASLETRWTPSSATGVSFTTARPSSGRFDAVVCSLVLCCVDDDTCAAVIRDLACRVGPDGRVLVAICHPGCSHRTSTSFQVPVGEPGPYGTFAWTTRVGAVDRDEYHRPLAILRRLFLEVGLGVEIEHETSAVDLQRFEPTSDFLVLALRPVVRRADVTLVLRSCVLDGGMIEHQSRHIVRQLEPPAPFAERILVVDARSDGFTRGWTQPDPDAFERAVRRLVADGVVHRVVRGPEDGTDVNDRWFGIESAQTHTAAGAPNVATLHGLDEVRTRYAVQVDADVLIHRPDRTRDWLEEPLRRLRGEPTAVSVSLPIVRRDRMPFETRDRDANTWRLEVRASVLDLERLRALRPLPTARVDEAPATSWHRAVDARLREAGGTTLRGGDPSFGFVHPPNDRKADRDRWLLAMERLEAGFVPDVQRGQVELVGDVEAWLGPKRTEPYVFLVQGREVAPGRFRRCIASLVRQTGRAWGAIVMDDGSDPEAAEELVRACAPFAHRITVVCVRKRRGKLANTVWAVRHLVAHPDAVMIMLDADDALLGDRVLDRVGREYDGGADMTIGSMLRTDKVVDYSRVDLVDPRAARGGFVWQHLRTFKKRLFEAIPDEYLRVGGSYVELAEDWAVTVPMVELAANPVHIPDPLYLHEPSARGRGDEHDAREATIAALMSRARLRPTPQSDSGGRGVA